MDARPPSFADIESAASLLRGKCARTPLLNSPILDARCGAKIFIKPECLQRTGSFKFRGAYNALARLGDDREEKGIVAASSGNHAQGIGEAARLLGIKATIIMPEDAPEVKKKRTERTGAKIVFCKRTDDRDAIAHRYAQENGAYFIHPFDNAAVIAGQGTAGLEVAQDLEKAGLVCDRLLVPTGGGGLIGGVSLAISRFFESCVIHPVEPTHYDDYRQSLEKGERVKVAPRASSVCDAIVTPCPGRLSFEIGSGLFSEGLTVSDEEALEAVAFAFSELNLAVEPGGAVALAALLSGKIEAKGEGETIVIFLSGGNMDGSVMKDALSRLENSG